MRQGYGKRITLCVAGLLLYALGNFFGVIAGSAGTNAWNTLSIGLSESMNISFGTASFTISLAIIAVDLVFKGKLGLGTVMNVVLISIFSDWFLKVFTFLPAAEGGVLGVVYTLIGQVVLGFATIAYMTPGLGCGPRDTLMLIIGKKFPKAPIGAVKFGIEVCVLVIGVLMGAPFGIGTVLVMALQASIFQGVCRITRYEPRDIRHEDLADTLRNLLKKA